MSVLVSVSLHSKLVLEEVHRQSIPDMSAKRDYVLTMNGQPGIFTDTKKKKKKIWGECRWLFA